MVTGLVYRWTSFTSPSGILPQDVAGSTVQQLGEAGREMLLDKAKEAARDSVMEPQQEYQGGVVQHSIARGYDAARALYSRRS